MPEMAVVDQKEWYHRQAALCYEIAAKMTPKKAASMVRLGDTYVALAIDPDRRASNIFVPTKRFEQPKYAGGKCGSPVRFHEPALCRPCRHFAEIVAVKVRKVAQPAALSPKVLSYSNDCHS